MGGTSVKMHHQSLLARRGADIFQCRIRRPLPKQDGAHHLFYWKAAPQLLLHVPAPQPRQANPNHPTSQIMALYPWQKFPAMINL